MSCMKCGARPVMGSDVCHAHGGKPNDWDSCDCPCHAGRLPGNCNTCAGGCPERCEFGEIHISGVPCRWCDPVEGEW